jgi:gamma-glutamyltranspeptidase
VIIMPTVKSSLNAQNTFTKPLALRSRERASVSVSGVFDALVTLQRRFGSGAWRDVQNPDSSVGFTTPTEMTYEADESCEMQLGIKTGNYVSGTAVCRLGKG